MGLFPGRRRAIIGHQLDVPTMPGGRLPLLQSQIRIAGSACSTPSEFRVYTLSFHRFPAQLCCLGKFQFGQVLSQENKCGRWDQFACNLYTMILGDFPPRCGYSHLTAPCSSLRLAEREGEPAAFVPLCFRLVGDLNLWAMSPTSRMGGDRELRLRLWGTWCDSPTLECFRFPSIDLSLA